MKITICVFLLLNLNSIASAQDAGKPMPAAGIPPPNLVSAGSVIATGNFSSTHSIGFTMEYSRCRYSFGKRSSGHPILLSYAVNAGFSHFAGRKETVSGYPYKYPGNSWLYAAGGVMLLPAPPVNISITAGPGLMFYNKNTSFGLTAKAEINYFFWNRVAVSPAIQLFKESSAGAIWCTGLKGGFSF